MIDSAPTSAPPGACGFSALRRALLAAVALLASSGVLLVASAGAASAKTYYVAPTGSGSVCASNSASQPFATIQAALACAANKDVISLAPSGSTPYPGVGPVTHSVTIKAGSGNASSVMIDLRLPADSGGYSAGLMSVPAGTSVKLQGLTMECSTSDTLGCLSPGCNDGGACVGSLITNNGTLSLTGVVVTGAEHGAAINNVSTGPAGAQLTVLDSAIVNNTDDGLASDLSQAAGISSTLEGGGGIGDPLLTVTNSTIADNSAGSGGTAGAIATNAPQNGAVTLVGDTITANSGFSGGGVAANNGTSTTVVMSNTLLAGNSSPNSSVEGPDCQGHFADGSGGHNLIGNASHCNGPTNGVNGDLVSVPDPGLNPLAQNGGPSETVSLQPQSPAIGAGDAATCLAAPVSGLDQRGDSRRVNTRGCDIGAYDTGGSAVAGTRTWYVSPSGSDTSCASNSSSLPFSTIQAAVACAGDGDVISLAPSGSKPYPGVGPLTNSVTIKAGAGDARSVKIDLRLPADAGGFSSGLISVPSTASVKLQGLTLECTASDNFGCLSTGCEDGGACAGSLITNNGTLSLNGVQVSGAQHGAAIDNISTATAPARLTVLDSAIVHNANDGGSADASQAAGISATYGGSGVAPPRVTVTNTTISDNSATSGGDPGAIYSNSFQSGAVTLINDTITGNQGIVGGITDDGASATPPVVLTNTVLANSTYNTNPTTAAPDCDGQLADGPGGHNLIADDNNCTGLTNGTDGDQVGTQASPIDPQLAPVAANGGATETAPPLNGSPLIGTADSATCETGPVFDLDQRGTVRNAPTRHVCDIGAYDTGGKTGSQTAPSITSHASAIAHQSKPFAFTVTTTSSPKPALSESGALPSGVFFTDNGTGTASFTGTPAAGSTGTYPITITATDGVAPDASQSFTLTVRSS